MQVKWELEVPAGGTTVEAVTTHDFINITDDQTDNTWTGDDFDAVEDAFSQALADLSTYMHDGCLCVEGRWYKFGPSINPTQQDPQAPVRIHQFNDPGGVTDSGMPHQIAVSVTERTPVRKRWGRFYLPGIAKSQVSLAGAIGTAATAAFADAFEDFYGTCYANEHIPVVWSPTVKRAYAVTMVQVDNVLDVIRSRRMDAPTDRQQRPTP